MKASSFEVVDAHQHFWDPARNFHPWLAEDASIPFRYGDYSAIKRRYLPPDYFIDAAGFDVRETVYVETEWDPADPLGETGYATSLAERYGVPNAIVAQAWLDREDAEAVIDAQAAFALVRSVRHKPGGPARPHEVGTTRTLMSDERWRRGYERVRVNGLNFDLQTPWWNLDEAVTLARDFPEVSIVLNHTGLPSDRSADGLAAWRAHMARLAECPNAYVKISGLGDRSAPWTIESNSWIVRETIAMFGARRAMFASNFPVDSLCATFATIFSGFKRITENLSDRDQKNLFCDTARQLYRTKSAVTSLDALTPRTAEIRP